MGVKDLSIDQTSDHFDLHLFTYDNNPKVFNNKFTFFQFKKICLLNWIFMKCY